MHALTQLLISLNKSLQLYIVSPTDGGLQTHLTPLPAVAAVAYLQRHATLQLPAWPSQSTSEFLKLAAHRLIFDVYRLIMCPYFYLYMPILYTLIMAVCVVKHVVLQLR